MFEPFSSGYYLGRLYVEPYEGERAVVHRDHHERVNEQMYADDEEADPTDAPLVMKVGPAHVSVHGAADVPERTLGLPDEVLVAAGVDNPPTLREVLLAKRDVAARLLDMGAAGV